MTTLLQSLAGVVVKGEEVLLYLGEGCVSVTTLVRRLLFRRDYYDGVVTVGLGVLIKVF